MSTIYQNIDFGSYSAEPSAQEYGKEYVITLETAADKIPASNYEESNSYSTFVSNMMNGNVAGFAMALMNDDSNKIFVNMSDIVLPTEIGETVEGTMQLVSFPTTYVEPQ